MLREPNPHAGWHSPPPQSPPEPPLDHVPVEPPYVGVHPIKRGLAAVLVFVGVVAVSPLIILGVLIWLWWEALSWATR